MPWSLNKRNLSLTILEVGKSKIKASANSVPGKGPLPGLQRAALTWYLHMAERERSSFMSFLLRAFIPFISASLHDLVTPKRPTSNI